MKTISLCLALAGSTTLLYAQQKPSDSITKKLDEVIVTGQYEPQSIRKSVYQVRTINNKTIQSRSATSVQQVLNTELGIRFSNDMALGTSDIQLMGMSGRNVKILLDGVPMVDRGETRESLNQIDINTIERIEIVEGPMSVSYGTDALAGVINIITKKPGVEKILVTAKIQEESAGNEYQTFNNEGIHNQNINLSWQKNAWNASAGFSLNNFEGWQGDTTGRVKQWHPKSQLLGNAKVGYTTGNFTIYYRLDALNEDILANGGQIESPLYDNPIARDKKYTTNRFTNQMQSNWLINRKLNMSFLASYTNYKRKTQTTVLDLVTDTRTLSTDAAEQDVSKFSSAVFRTTVQYKLSDKLSFQPGLDLNMESASGQRIAGSPSINDYAFFVSAEIKPLSIINIRPGLRFIYNSVYDATPLIPSVNTKFNLSDHLDLRLAYARGFRSPALRELYFNFFDASHSIKGNPDLKAEHSNSFNGSVEWNKGIYRSVLSGFYNDFNNLINYGTDPNNPTVTMTINVDRFKTTGGTFENSLVYKNLTASVGISYIGRYNELSAMNDLPEFVWSPELNSNISYLAKKIGTTFSLFYKFTGKKPSYQYISSNGGTSIKLTETSSFNWADISISKAIKNYLTISGGVKNLFDVTELNNTSTDTGSAHSSGGGAVPYSYGRSFFLGLNFRLAKN